MANSDHSPALTLILPKGSLLNMDKIANMLIYINLQMQDNTKRKKRKYRVLYIQPGVSSSDQI